MEKSDLTESQLASGLMEKRIAALDAWRASRERQIYAIRQTSYKAMHTAENKILFLHHNEA
jgi:hypothetical protein